MNDTSNTSINVSCSFIRMCHFVETLFKKI